VAASDQSDQRFTVWNGLDYMKGIVPSLSLNKEISELPANASSLSLSRVQLLEQK
jgi:hypothetical protein